METRRFGSTNHFSTVAIFGAAALWDVSQFDADRTMEMVIEYGVNHIDVAPSYGEAERRLGPWIARERQRFFLGCKTMERTKAGAAAELHRSLERLQTDRFDLYQIHAITNLAELDQVTRSGGALEAMVEAKEKGLTRFIGITGHGVESPGVFVEALNRFDFDSVLFPVNFVQYTNPEYRKNAEALLQICRQKDVGTMIIKSIAKAPWGDRRKTHSTWYEPFTDPDRIQMAVDFVLSKDVTGLCTPGDITLLPHVLDACENHSALTNAQQDDLVNTAAAFEPLFA